MRTLKKLPHTPISTAFILMSNVLWYEKQLCKNNYNSLNNDYQKIMEYKS